MFGFYDSYFKFFDLTITYYGFLIAIGMGLGVFIATKIAYKRGLKSDDLLLLACYVLPLSIIGARLYYVIFSSQEFSFWEVFAIWKGGMAIYGGIIGGAIGVILFCVIHKKNFISVADIALTVLPLGQAIGRIGCYFAGCCYGVEVTNENAQWFPLATQIDGVWRYSTFFYESFCDFIIFVVLLILVLKVVKTKGIISGSYMLSYGVVRAIIETFRGDSLYLGAIKVSQLLSILVAISGLIMIVTFLLLQYRPKWLFKKVDDKKQTEDELDDKINHEQK